MQYVFFFSSKGVLKIPRELWVEAEVRWNLWQKHQGRHHKEERGRSHFVHHDASTQGHPGDKPEEQRCQVHKGTPSGAWSTCLAPWRRKTHPAHEVEKETLKAPQLYCSAVPWLLCLAGWQPPGALPGTVGHVPSSLDDTSVPSSPPHLLLTYEESHSIF